MHAWRRLHGDERGLEGIEYLLIAALVIIAAIGAWRLLGRRVSTDVTKVADTVDGTVADSIAASGGSGTPSDAETKQTVDLKPNTPFTFTVTTVGAGSKAAGISAKATGPGWSQAGPAYEKTGTFSMQIKADKPGTILDTVGINGAPKGSFSLSMGSDGRIRFQVYDPSASSSAKISNGWHVIASDPVDMGAANQVSVKYGANGTTLTVNGKDYSVPELKTTLSGNPVYLGDYPGDSSWEPRYDTKKGFTGNIDGLQFSGPGN